MASDQATGALVNRPLETGAAVQRPWKRPLPPGDNVHAECAPAFCSVLRKTGRTRTGFAAAANGCAGRRAFPPDSRGGLCRRAAKDAP